jgi:hypothetical protein
MGVLNRHNLVTAVVNPLEIGWWREIKSKLESIVGGIELHQMFDG